MFTCLDCGNIENTVLLKNIRGEIMAISIRKKKTVMIPIDRFLSTEKIRVVLLSETHEISIDVDKKDTVRPMREQLEKLKTGGAANAMLSDEITWDNNTGQSYLVVGARLFYGKYRVSDRRFSSVLMKNGDSLHVRWRLTVERMGDGSAIRLSL